MENWLSCHAQRVLTSSTNSTWRPVSTGVLQWLMLGLYCFNILIYYLDDGTESTLNKFVEDTRLGDMADAPEGWAAIWRDLDRLQKWVNRRLLLFSKGKWSLEPGEEQYGRWPAGTQVCKKGYGEPSWTWPSNVPSQQRRSTAFWVELGRALLSTGETHLEWWGQLWTPQHKRDIERET